MILQKVETRKWLHTKELFQSYAIDKLAIMQRLKLSERESIHLLINGINSRALRGTATALPVTTVDQFLDQMHNIAIAYGDAAKPVSTQNIKTEKSKDVGISNTKKDQQ